MKAFISYSLNDSEQFVLTILSQQLGEEGFIVISNYGLNFTNETQFQINNSNLLIGLITRSGDTNNRVFQEWQYASNRRIPAILLVENTVHIHQSIQHNENVVRFDRNNPNRAIESVRNKISLAKQTVQANNDKAVAWIIGGVAVLALIGLLSNKK